MTKSTLKAAELPWEYCECGCKGYTLSLGSQHFSVYWDRKDGYYLGWGHSSLSTQIGKFDSFEAVDRKVRELAKPRFERELAAMKESAELFGTPSLSD
jgi:hypothetical protein